MKLRNLIWALLPCLLALVTCGCPRKVVTTAMPAPMPTQPLPLSQRQPPPDQPPPVIPPSTDPAPHPQLPSTDPEPAPAAPVASPAPTTRPRSTSAEADVAKAGAEPAAPAAPVIAPALSKQDLANAVRLTSNDQRAAQRTLQIASGKRLNPSQADLFDKVKGFLDQTEEAKKADDWVRAQNLAHKAQVLAAELMKSL